jgi:uncharacterized integral membrane protein
MKRLLEPVAGIILSYASWQAWTDLIVSLLVAFLGGALAYAGKCIAARIMRSFNPKNKRNNSEID